MEWSLNMLRKNIVLLSAACIGLAVCTVVFTQDVSVDGLRKKATQERKNGNVKDALELYKKILENRDATGPVEEDLYHAVNCLKRLRKDKEIDNLLDKTVKTHPSDWRVLNKAAYILCHIVPHYGYIIAGEFERGRHRGGGTYAVCQERDRARALQLIHKAVPAAAREKNKTELGNFYLGCADMILFMRTGHQSWKLQTKTDITELPDVHKGYYYGYHSASGAPVDENGDPVFYTIPDTLKKAENDGQRWRWFLVQAMETAPSQKNTCLTRFADFLMNQFGVQTLSAYSGLFRRNAADTEEGKSSVFSLRTLKETETIARLASGVKRFSLPDEFNFIRIYKEIADAPKTGYGAQSLEQLAGIFENRMQFTKAADYWKRVIAEHGPGYKNSRKKRLAQITDNWGTFEGTMAQPAGKGAEVGFRFRNGNHVSFTAHRLKIDSLLESVKNYVKSKPKRLDWNKLNLGNIGYRIVRKNESRFIDKQVASWNLDLEPRPNHYDRSITVTTPLQKAGAYLLKAKMKDGNTSRIIVWLNNTAIVQKRMSQKAWFYIADSRTGAPLEKINVEFFGYDQDWVRGSRSYQIKTRQFAEFSDKTGQITLSAKEFSRDYKWLIIARGNNRLAYHGFSNIWYSTYYDSQYTQNKTYIITDRPVYRPDHTVKFKAWIRKAQYDMENKSVFANKNFHIRIHNPKREKVFDKSYKTDEWSGLAGEYTLAKDAALGVYRITIAGYGGATFRVEEYKKPEFEVSVQAPEKPVKLGDKFKATIQAKYYFGAPVTKGKVTYTVKRSSHSANWYAPMPWDWFYGSGYWWFTYEYTWYPGWHKWGFCRPRGWWWGNRHNPPEVVMKNEVDVGPDGKVEIEIDTALAKEIHGDQDHRYSITAEVTDESRRTIVGSGSVIAARNPFQVHVWVNNGYYRVGDTVEATVSARTVSGNEVTTDGKLELFRISYKKDGTPVETSVRSWKIQTGTRQQSSQKLKASEPGQYRLSCTLTDSEKHTREGGYIFCVRGKGFDGSEFRFNDLELIPDKKEYAPGESAQLMINTNRTQSTVLLFKRPSNGIYLEPEVLSLKGKSTLQTLNIGKKDMPNVFVEALTISNGKVHTQVKEIIIPPEKRVLNVKASPSKKEYKPGEKASVRIKLTDSSGKAFHGTTVVSVYDKSVEYISGGSNVSDIKAFFWKWRRRHYPRTMSNLSRYFGNLLKKHETGMSHIGRFGHMVATMGGKSDSVDFKSKNRGSGTLRKKGMSRREEAFGAVADKASAAPASPMASAEKELKDGDAPAEPGKPSDGMAEPAVRKNFADTAFWAGSVTTDKDGFANISFDMPENLTGWKVRVWAMGHGTKVGQTTEEVVTAKNLMLRLQAPRFFVEKDEVVLSANIHNYLDSEKKVSARLELDGKSLELMGSADHSLTIKPNGEQRVDWRVKATAEGTAVIRMKALTDEESDAMEKSFTVYVHGMEKMVPVSTVIRPEQEKTTFTIDVPKERRINESRLEIRYSPTLAGAMVDALPYLAEYPYGCTEQTLNRFLPTVITYNVLNKMGLDLKAIRDKRTNLNAQEIGDDKERSEQWKKNRTYTHDINEKLIDYNPVFDEKEVQRMVKTGVRRLTAMQLSDGGWGWFSGYYEHSTAHTTATVVHGLQVARQNDVAIVPGVLERGVNWLRLYQNKQVQLLKNALQDKKPYKDRASNKDAFTYMVLVDAGEKNSDMLTFLYRDRNHLSVYAKAMFGIALHKQKKQEKLEMIMQNIEQYLEQDDENQTAWLNLPNNGYWWYWYGSEYEAHAYYLKLLSHLEPKGKKASRLVKYLLNNRKHATYWNSTRDTALCIEAMADYLKASDEMSPDLTLEIYVDGKKHKEATVNKENLFTYDNKLVLLGDAVETGKHTIEIRKKGKGPLYINSYLSYFSLEDFITKAGLEVKVQRKYYKLIEADKKIKVAGSRGQAVDHRVEKYKRQKLSNLATLKSGDLVEIELEIESKNDYEYIIFEDMKAAGFEPVDVRSGYRRNGLGAYMEFRDNRVCMFVQRLARGRHSISYRVRAEIPGQFSALPTRAYAMYAPEIRGNSDEIKLKIKDTDPVKKTAKKRSRK